MKQKKINNINQHDNTFGSFFPITLKVAAKTIGLDLIPVFPMDSYEFDERQRIRKREQRKKKIEELFPDLKNNEK